MCWGMCPHFPKINFKTSNVAASERPSSFSGTRAQINGEPKCIFMPGEELARKLGRTLAPMRRCLWLGRNGEERIAGKLQPMGQPARNDRVAVARCLRKGVTPEKN